MKKEISLPLRNPKKRDLSPFMAEQLLYDYATKKIDFLREKAVTEALENSPELSKSLDDIIYGMTYCHHLQKTVLSPESLEKFKAPPSLWSQIKRYRNMRNWNQTTLWLIEAFAIIVVVLLLAFAIPWPHYIKDFMTQRAPWNSLTEVSKDKNYEAPKETPSAMARVSSIDYSTVGQLLVVNPEFTTNKLLELLPRLGASIEHQALRKNSQDEINPFFQISIPSDKANHLILELKSQGQLTWLTPLSENKEGSQIFGFELWILKKMEPKAQPPTKDFMGE